MIPTALTVVGLVLGVPTTGLGWYFWADYFPGNYRKRYRVYRTLVRHQGFDFKDPKERIEGSANIFLFALREATKDQKDNQIEDSVINYRIVDTRTNETVFDTSKA